MAIIPVLSYIRYYFIGWIFSRKEVIFVVPTSFPDRLPDIYAVLYAVQ
jgi:hypothetical protein